MVEVDLRPRHRVRISLGNGALGQGFHWNPGSGECHIQQICFRFRLLLVLAVSCLHLILSEMVETSPLYTLPRRTAGYPLKHRMLSDIGERPCGQEPGSFAYAGIEGSLAFGYSFEPHHIVVFLLHVMLLESVENVPICVSTLLDDLLGLGGECRLDFHLRVRMVQLLHSAGVQVVASLFLKVVLLFVKICDVHCFIFLRRLQRRDDLVLRLYTKLLGGQAFLSFLEDFLRPLENRL